MVDKLDLDADEMLPEIVYIGDKTYQKTAESNLERGKIFYSTEEGETKFTIEIHSKLPNED